MTDDEKFLAEATGRYRAHFEYDPGFPADVPRLIAMVRERDAKLAKMIKGEHFLCDAHNRMGARIAELETQLKWATENQQGRDIKIENSPREKALESALREVDSLVKDADYGLVPYAPHSDEGVAVEKLRAARKKIKEVLG